MRTDLSELDLVSRVRAAPAVLKGLKSDEGIFEELRLASQRPFASYSLEHGVENPKAILLWHLPNLRAACARLQLKACAELALGESEAALADLKLTLYLIDSIRKEPVMISQLVRLSDFQTATQPVWEGLAQHAWSPAQLKELNGMFRRLDFLADCNFFLEAQRASALWTIDCLARSEHPAQLLGSPSEDKIEAHVFGDKLTRLICQIVPSGWYAREKIDYCQRFQECLGTGFDFVNRRVSPEKIQNCVDQDSKEDPPLNYFEAVRHHRIAASSLLKRRDFDSIRRFCFAQVTADQSVLACALEEYRLSHGSLPETLDSIVPEFISQLPRDSLTGETYEYKRVDSTHFLLYSVGWNEMDEEGTVALTKEGSINLKSGDWVWAGSLN